MRKLATPYLIETLATGDEVVTGDVIDSNSAEVSRRLMASGHFVTRHLALPDDFDLLLEGLKAVSERADLCIVSGGMGPTEDDLTADVVARLAQKPLVLNTEAVERMRERFTKYNIRFPENNLRQARIPEGALVCQNEVGTAPAFSLKIGRCQFFFLPGVPKEFRFFLDHLVFNWIQSHWPEGNTEIVQLKTMGVPESQLAEDLSDFSYLFPQVRVGYRAHSSEVWVKLTAQEESRELSMQVVAPAVKEASRRLGDKIFARDRAELIQVTHDLALESGASIAVAESCTGGALAAKLVSLPGSSKYFRGGVVCYQDVIKSKLLGIEPKFLSKFGAVSADCAQAMAEGALKQFDAQIGISITGVAGPDGGTAKTPVGLVYLCLAVQGQITRVLEKRFRGERDRVQAQAVAHGLNLVREGLLQFKNPPKEPPHFR